MGRLILIVLFFVGCTAPVKDPEKNPSSDKIPEFTIPQEVSLVAIDEIVKQSQCAKRSWKDRGVAPLAYFQGVARVYGRAVCNPNLGNVLVISKPPQPKGDALTHYGIKEPDYLKATYALLIGLGLRESTGKYCEGRDAAATNVSSDTAEAGLFQSSYNSRIRVVNGLYVKDPILVGLYEKYKASDSGCLLSVFSKGVRCSDSDAKNWGTGEGVLFQKLSKACPAFSTEYAAVMLRTARSHYGPLNTKAAEYRAECVSMLESVKNVVKTNPELCSSL